MSLKRSRSPSSSLSPPPPPALPPPVADAPASPPPAQPAAKRARKAKKLTAADVDPAKLPARSTGRLRIGAHVSAAGGVENSCLGAALIGATAFALFVKNQRQWTAPPLDPTAPGRFKAACQKFSYDPSRDILPHGSYLVNLANPDPAKRDKSFACFLDELQRSEAFGIGMFNFHPGSAMKEDRPTALGYVADAINRAHRATSSITVVLENMAGQGDVLGSRFEDLRGIIDLVDDKDRIGVCIDTCHLFAASVENELRTPELADRTLTAFFETVPPRYLKALHVNDSKFALGGKKDRHANLGLGEIGLRGFFNLLHWPGPGKGPFAPGKTAWACWEDVVWVLETPVSTSGVWKREIQLLHQLDALADDSTVPALEAAWKAEFARLHAASRAAKPKATAKAAAGKGKGKGKARELSEEDETDTDDGAEEDDDANYGAGGSGGKKGRKAGKAAVAKKAPRKRKAALSSDDGVSDGEAEEKPAMKPPTPARGGRARRGKTPAAAAVDDA